jgi:hypothetical protein
VLLAGGVLAGCTRTAAAPPSLPDGQVLVAPGVVLTLPPPAALAPPAEAAQLIAAHYQDRSFVFETRLSLTRERLLVVGTDMMGRRAMTIEWTGTRLTAEAAPWVPANLPPRNVVADITLLHAPDAALHAGLAPSVSVETPQPGTRVIALGDQPMIRIERTDHGASPWAGHWIYRNLAWGYSLDIQSVESPS